VGSAVPFRMALDECYFGHLPFINGGTFLECHNCQCYLRMPFINMAVDEGYSYIALAVMAFKECP